MRRWGKYFLQSLGIYVDLTVYMFTSTPYYLLHPWISTWRYLVDGLGGRYINDVCRYIGLISTQNCYNCYQVTCRTWRQEIGKSNPATPEEGNAASTTTLDVLGSPPKHTFSKKLLPNYLPPSVVNTLTHYLGTCGWVGLEKWMGKVAPIKPRVLSCGLTRLRPRDWVYWMQAGPVSMLMLQKDGRGKVI